MVYLILLSEPSQFVEGGELLKSKYVGFAAVDNDQSGLGVGT